MRIHEIKDTPEDIYKSLESNGYLHATVSCTVYDYENDLNLMKTDFPDTDKDIILYEKVLNFLRPINK